MRKTDKAAKQNKPSKAKVEGSGIGTLKPSKEERAENKKIIKLPSGFSYEFEKMKAEITARKNKKFSL